MKQHYIPRCYLKRFSDNDKCIYAYDKQHSKKYQASLMSVCVEDDMYSISNDYLEKNKVENGGKINRLSIEKDHFAKMVEPMFSQLLRTIDEIKNEWITNKEYYRLNFYEKREIALHIVTQYFRLPQLQEATIDDYLRMEKAGIDMVKHIMSIQTGNEAFNNLQIGVECEKPVLHANLTYLNDEVLMDFADAIANNYWVFWVSLAQDFYTSDFPLVVEPHVDNVRPTYIGLSQYGSELTYPLSPSIVLSVFDKHCFTNKASLDSSFIIADAKEVRRQNMLRYFYATHHVFSYKKDFSLIDFIYETEKKKHIFMAPNLKSEIVSGLGRY